MPDRGFDNLLTNAIKYGCFEETSKITISCEAGDEETIFRVQDTGPGIPPEFHDKIFLPFERLQTEGEGTGVGLAILKRIIENHGGRIWGEKDESPGTTFLFSIPRTNRPPPRDDCSEKPFQTCGNSVVPPF